MPYVTLRPSSFVLRLLSALTVLTLLLATAGNLAAAGSAPAGVGAGVAPAASGTPAPGTAAPSGVITSTTALTGTAVLSGTAAVSVTATSAPPTAPPAVTVTLAPPTPTAVYPPIPKTSGVPRFEPGPCNFDLPAGQVEGKDVKCGMLIVHEEHADPESPTIQLAVAILPALATRPQADPIVFNQGGPGYGSIDTYLPLLYNSTFRARRDVILFDQRGTGHSTRRCRAQRSSPKRWPPSTRT